MQYMSVVRFAVMLPLLPAFVNLLLLVYPTSSSLDGEKKNFNNETSEIKSKTADQGNLKLRSGVTIPSNNMEAYMSTVEIIINRGYHAEMHPVITEDDYILMLHRIPYSKGRKSGPTGKPVFIQHGLAGSSSDFVMLPTEKSIAFILADLGYDVWLGNSRGNIYSRGHVTYDSEHEKAYWEFSFDEIGRYDVPANINHILTVTGRKKLQYVGMSMGSTVFFTFLHHHPGLSDKIESSVLLAPVATIAHVWSVLRFFIPFTRVFQFLLWFFNADPYFFSSTGGIYYRFVRRFCLRSDWLAILCHNALFFINGVNYGNMDPNMINVVYRHLPAGTSTRTVAHYSQNAVFNWDQSPRFNQYSYGWVGNLKRYGQINPPAYDLSKVTVPVYIFHGANDYVATPTDVQWLVSKLPNVKQVIVIKDPKFNHLDFAFHRDAKELVYDQITALLSTSLNY